MEDSSSDCMESSNAGELIKQFLEFAAGQSDETARKYLQVTDWNVDQAVSLFYGQQEGSDDSDPFKKVASSKETPNTIADRCSSKNRRKKQEKDEFFGWVDRAKDRDYHNSMRRFHDPYLMSRMRGMPCGMPFPDCGDGDERMPLDDRMPFPPGYFPPGYGCFDRRSMFHRGFGNERMPPSPERKEVPEPKVEKVEEPEDKFESMYRPPKELMHKGALHDAKQAAEEQDKWLIVNVQSKKEFSSQTLNLDVWANEMVAQTIGANFIFWQVYDDTDEGKKVCEYYNLKDFPAVLVLDPITRHMKRSWTKKIDAERLVEDLVPFMDASPKEHHAKFGPPVVTSAVSETTKEDEKVKAAPDSDENMTDTTVAPTETTREEEEVKASPASDENMTDTIMAPTETTREDEEVKAAPASKEDMTDTIMAPTETTREEEEVKASPASKEDMTATTIDENQKLTYPDLPEEPKVDEDETLLS